MILLHFMLSWITQKVFSYPEIRFGEVMQSILALMFGDGVKWSI